MLSPKIREAQSFARQQHKGQTRKHGPDYDFHPEDVAALLTFRYNEDNEDAVCAALLHDVLEEGDTSAEEISRRFGPAVAEMVVALTRDKDCPYEEYSERLAKQPPVVVLIKGCDVISNLRDSILADNRTVRRAMRIAANEILPVIVDSLGKDHLVRHDLVSIIEAVERKAAPLSSDGD
jgi:(p)ppGpp synthase/HD superfamily hydrolase